MKETYLSRDFRETAAQCFPSQAKELNAFFDARLNVLLAENADASKEKQYHLQRQILPGVAAYETLQRVMPKEEALQTVHGYVEELARTSHKQLAALLHIPGLYRLVPGVFVKSTRSVFGPAAGFDSKELQVGNGIWRVDIATTLLPETENKRRSSYRSIADTSFFSYFLDCVSSDLPPGGLLPLHHEAAVEPVNSNQLVVGALLDDLTVIDHKNLVGMAHGFQPVGDHDDRLIMGQLRRRPPSAPFHFLGQHWRWLRPE